MRTAAPLGMAPAQFGGASVPTRIILAEDETVIRMDLKEELTRQGYLVVGDVGDGQSAVNLARELRPDLVVMDVRMPEMDGISAAEILTREKISPVVLLTAFSDDELIERARDGLAQLGLANRLLGRRCEPLAARLTGPGGKLIDALQQPGFDRDGHLAHRHGHTPRNTLALCSKPVNATAGGEGQVASTCLGATSECHETRR